MSDIKIKQKILIILRDIGHYHHARFQLLAEEYDVTVIETRTNNKEYAWDRSYLINPNYKLETFISTGKFSLFYNSFKILYHRNFKLVFTYGWADFEYILFLFWCKILRIKIITGCDSTLEDSQRIRIKERIKAILVRRFDAILSAGKRTDRYLSSLHFKKPILHPYDVVDNKYFQEKSDAFKSNPQKRKEKELPDKYILNLGRFIVKKNLESLLKAYIEIINDDPNFEYSLVLVGSGEENQKLMDLSEKSLNRIKIVPFVQYDELPLYYSYADAFIITSNYDQWGLVVNEAMACGLPVLVSSGCGCADDLVEEGVNGYVFNPTLAEIKKVILQFSTLTEIQKTKLGNSSRIKIDEFSIQKHLRAIQKII